MWWIFSGKLKVALVKFRATNRKLVAKELARKVKAALP